VSLTYERPIAATLNGRNPGAPSSENTGCSGYTGDELALRTGIPRAALHDGASGPFAPGGGREHYAAIDVVRLAVVDRLVRSGVPVARATALVRAAESHGHTPIQAGQAFPNSGTGVQTGSAMTASH
jgi:hypothetical protein